jgi:hypothetical protein
MTGAIELALSPRPLERTPADVAVVGFFTDERPLRGGAARADWRLCGGLSRRIESGDLSGKSGEALLIGTGRALRAPRLLLLGLGDRAAYDRLRLSDESRQALDRVRRLGCRHVALAPLGVAPDDVPRHAPALLAGIREAWREASEDLTVHLCVRREEMPAIQRALEEARDAADAAEIRISTPEEALERA